MRLLHVVSSATLHARQRQSALRQQSAATRQSVQRLVTRLAIRLSARRVIATRASVTRAIATRASARRQRVASQSATSLLRVARRVRVVRAAARSNNLLNYTVKKRPSWSLFYLTIQLNIVCCNPISAKDYKSLDNISKLSDIATPTHL